MTSSTALITGASSGIGYAMAKVFASHGHNLVLVARNAPRLEELAGELRGQYNIAVEVLPKDLASGTAAQELFDALQEKSISIDILVNNAGFDVYGNFYETDLKEELELIQVNLVTLTQLTKLFLAGMRRRGYGRILNVGSTGSFVPSPLNAVYSATKAYVLSFSEAIADELEGSGVTVTAICPGATRSNFHKRADMMSIPLLRFGVLSAETVAMSGYRALMAGKRVVVPGFYNQMQVLFARLLPGSLVAKMAKIMLRSS